MTIHRIKVFKGADGDWYIRLIAGNNEPLFTSEGHQNKGDASQIANSVSNQLIDPVPVEIEE
jgi:uncharacterized protein YegP (UPF0339 family)